MEKSIYDVLIGNLTLGEVIRPTELDYLHVVPSAMSLVGAEVELVSMISRETRFRTSLEGMADEYEYIIVDMFQHLEQPLAPMVNRVLRLGDAVELEVVGQDVIRRRVASHQHVLRCPPELLEQVDEWAQGPEELV